MATQYTGVAQHFTLTLFDNVDLIQQMELKPVVQLPNWEQLESLVRYYRSIAPASSTTLQQVHLFMVILLAYLDCAFVRWSEDSLQNLGGQDALSLHVMLIAAQISRDPLDQGTKRNASLGLCLTMTITSVALSRRKSDILPRKFMEFKRMEKAMNILLTGKSVNATALAVGYNDVYFFSRMFKQYMGVSPSYYPRVG